MSRPEPKFSVNQPVMFRYPDRPSLNHNYAKVESVRRFNKGDIFDDGRRINQDICVYTISTMSKKPIPEFYLQPIPKEKPNGIDAIQWIRDRCGVKA